MKVSRPRSVEVAENVLPMINVVFLLLIFFMLAGALRAAEVFEITPVSSNSAAQADERDGVFLVDGTGRIALEGKIIGQDKIETSIVQHLATAQSKVIRLKADARVSAARIIRFMEIARDAGAERVVLLTLESSE